jgi:protocatechuate 3,4-dioxygenase beta subunit
MINAPGPHKVKSSQQQPPYLHAEYVSTQKRAPQQALIEVPATPSELTGPSFAAMELGAHMHDLTAGHKGEPLGQRIHVSGRVVDDAGKPASHTLVELWQCNAAGRYLHDGDQHAAPLDPNFTGIGRVLTDAEGAYKFTTIQPGAYPWRNHFNAWRPAHIHFSLLGAAWATRLVTQMYFPGDPLLEVDPIFNSLSDSAARARLVCALDWPSTEPEHAIGYRFDIVLQGPKQTPWENAR